MSALDSIPGLSFGIRRRLPAILQNEAAECGLACLAMIAGYFGHTIDLLTLRQRFSFSLRGASIKNLVDVASALELSARPVKVEVEDLRHLRHPCILHWNMTHFVVLKRVGIAGGMLEWIDIHDPARGPVRVRAKEISTCFTGVAMELWPSVGFTPRVEKQRLRLRDMFSGAIGLRSALLRVFGLALALEIVAMMAPLFIQLVVDGPLASGDLYMLGMFAVGFGLLVVLQAAIGFTRSWAVLYIGTHLNLQWASNLFAHLLHLPLAYFEKRNMGDVVSRFNSIHTLRDILSTKFIEAVLDSLMAISALAVLLLYSPLLSAVAIAAAAAYLALRTCLFFALRTATEEQLTFKAAEQSMFLESLRGIQAIKLFNHENARHARWLNTFSASINRNIRTEQINLAFRAANTLLIGTENVLAIWLGARMVIDGQFSIGMLYAFLAYKLTFTTRTYALIDKFQELKMLSLHGERLADIVLTPREERAPVAVGEHQDALPIEVRNVSYRYSDADPWVLRDVSFSIAPGQSVAIIGQSGCGKTTLLKLLMGVLTPTRGEILVAGVPLPQFGVRRYRSLIGAVMQDDQLFAGTVMDNICFFDERVDLAWAEQCAESASIATELRAMPMGYQTLIGDMGTSLSGGQRQRILLARALYKRPRTLFLDEATSHLDMGNERNVNDAIRQLSLTRILVAHRQETIATAGRIIELEHGSVVRDLLQGSAEMGMRA